MSLGQIKEKEELEHIVSEKEESLKDLELQSGKLVSECVVRHLWLYFAHILLCPHSYEIIAFSSLLYYKNHNWLRGCSGDVVLSMKADLGSVPRFTMWGHLMNASPDFIPGSW